MVPSMLSPDIKIASLILLRFCTDVRMLVGDDESLEAGVLPALQKYNLEQFTVAEVPGAGHTVRIVHSGSTIYTHLPLLRCM